MSKSTIRQKLSLLRHHLTSSQKTQFSHEICQNIANTEFYQYAKTIGFYLSMPDEVNLSLLMSLSTDKLFYIPVLQQDFSLKFHHYQTSTPLKSNRWGILEPTSDLHSPIDILKLDLILFPLLGFDLKGHRLGMGKGCYDKSIPKNFPGKKIGVGFSSQQYPEVPHEEHDIHMDYIVTELQVIQCQGN